MWSISFNRKYITCQAYLSILYELAHSIPKTLLGVAHFSDRILKTYYYAYFPDDKTEFSETLNNLLKATELYTGAWSLTVVSKPNSPNL